MTESARLPTRSHGGAPAGVATIEPSSPSPPGILTRVAINEGVRAATTGGVFAGSAYATALITALPFSFEAMGGWMAFAALTTTSGATLARQGIEMVHRRLGNAPAVGEHVIMARAVRTAMASQIVDSPDFRRDAVKAYEAMRAIARSPLDEYVKGRGMPDGSGEPFRRRMREIVSGALERIESHSPHRRIGTLKLDRALRTLLPAYTALIRAPIDVVEKRVDDAQATNRSVVVKSPEMTARSSQGEIMRRGASGATQSANRMPKAMPPVARPVDPWRRMCDDLTGTDGEAADVVGEIERLKPRIAEVATDYLEVERRREISTLVDVHLPDMARSYVKAMRIASGDDLVSLRRRGLQGLMPVLQTLREAHAECVARATGEVDTKARFLEKRHPIVPDALRPIP